nr:MAG TPA: hypothetical protein [Caudoviricetes sp.]
MLIYRLLGILKLTVFGESDMNAFSDVGSTPTISTNL